MSFSYCAEFNMPIQLMLPFIECHTRAPFRALIDMSLSIIEKFKCDAVQKSVHVTV